MTAKRTDKTNRSKITEDSIQSNADASEEITFKKRRGRRSSREFSGRVALLDAATPAFAIQGFDGVNLRSVAAAARVDAALVIRHFGSKAALWSAVVERLAEQIAGWLERLGAICEATDSPVEERLTAFIECFVEVSSEIPQFGQFIASEAARPGERQDLVGAKLIGPFYALALPLIREAMVAGVVRAHDPVVFFSMLNCAIALPLAAPDLINRMSESLVLNSNQLTAAIKQAAVATFVHARRKPVKRPQKSTG